jgi:hypothetical protein
VIKIRWKEKKSGVEEILDRIESWADPDLKIHLLGWLSTETDDQIMEEAMEMVSALEEVAYTNTITKVGDPIMTDVVELCTILTTEKPDESVPNGWKPEQPDLP